ncbi:MAG: M50 family metallopeptidase [Pyrinomonadaceae bacterium]
MGYLNALKRRFRLMQIGGVPVWADYRWLIVLLLMSIIAAESLSASTGAGGAAYLAGVVTALAFFASVLLHEVAHAFVARLEGADVVEIVLHPFGGLARMKQEPETPRAEFRIAAAGPAASFLLALVFLASMAAAGGLEAALIVYVCFLLASFNFLIAVFNLFPGYPLDGGRLLRAYLWRSGRDIDEATVLTGRAGQLIGGAMVVLGLVLALLRQDLFTGFWMILVGIFLYDAATGIIREVLSLDRVKVMDVMRLPVAVEPDADVLYFVDHVLPVNRQSVFPVARDRQLFGMLLLDDLKRLERDVWRTTRVREVMRPVTVDHFVDAGDTLGRARELMQSNQIGAVGVLDHEGKLVGFLGGQIIKRKGSG